MKPRQILISLCVVVFLSIAAFSQADPADLDKVLDRMDKTAAAFHTTQASFVWDQYQKVVEETDTQKGKVYFRRSGNEVQMAADIQEPANEKKYVVFADSKIQLYQPVADQITVRCPVTVRSP